MGTIELAVDRLKTARVEAPAVPDVAASESWIGLQARLRAASSPCPAELPPLAAALTTFPAPLLTRGPAHVAEWCVVSISVGVALMYVVLALLGRPPGPEANLAVQHESSSATVAMPLLAPVATERVASTAMAAPAPDDADARAMVEQWAQAWSDRDVARYLDHYADDFTPDKGLSRNAWESIRRQRLAASRSILVTIRDLRIEPVGEGRVIARFAQDYVADAYRESGTAKMLVLARQSEGWRIVAEL